MLRVSCFIVVFWCVVSALSCGDMHRDYDDMECTPTCGEAECGDDGCGGSCGECADDELPCTVESCHEGYCTAAVATGWCHVAGVCHEGGAPSPLTDCQVCAPEESRSQFVSLPDGTDCGPDRICFGGNCCNPGAVCNIKECGDDGCGGSCGSCSPGEECVHGYCMEFPVECGYCNQWQSCDGGQCADSQDFGPCTAGGTAVSADCFDIGESGCCTGDVLYYCSNDALGCPAGLESCLCSLGCGHFGKSCGWNEWNQMYSCAFEEEAGPEPMGVHPWSCKDTCKPDCDGRECGGDGCGGICGACGELEECDAEGQCACYFELCDGLCCLDLEVCHEGACCKPSCEDRECGDDGCGGVCGYCSDEFKCTDEVCQDGACVFLMEPGWCLIDEVCVAQGNNPEGELCMYCDPASEPEGWSEVPQGYPCGAGNVCFKGSCCPKKEHCLGKICGDDGCGGDCGDCSDGDVCNGQESCTSGGCLEGTPLDCADDDPCTIDWCDPVAGCNHDPDNVGECSDDNECNGLESCKDKTCHPGIAMNCADGNLCTDDSCVQGQGCVNKDDDTNSCDDGDVCTGEEYCLIGTCQSKNPLECDDGNVCTEDSCEQMAGCVFVPAAGASCSDGNECNGEETCSESGDCVPGLPLPCDDGNVCTTDFCEPEAGCLHEGAAGECDDQDACTVDDSCLDGECIGVPLDCDDGNPCTSESCQEFGGEGTCYFANKKDGSPCDADSEASCLDGVCQ